MKSLAAVRSEKALILGVLTAAVFLGAGTSVLALMDSPAVFEALFVWLFAVMLSLSFGVVRHADSLAELLGEPYGTLILTLSVVGIEVVMIAAVMLTGENNPGLARDTMFSVLMIVLNGMLGMTLLVGGLKHSEQHFNLLGAQAYLGVLFPMATLGLILPRFTDTTPGGQVTPLMAGYLMVMSAGLYATFLIMQTMSHTRYFRQPEGGEGDGTHGHGELGARSVGYHVALLLLTMLPIVLLSKSMAKLVEHGLGVLGAPRELGGFLVAVLVLAPEGMGAVRAAMANQLQRTVNIALGSALSTIGMTIPAVLAISLLTGRTVELGLEPANVVLLVISMLVSLINFGAGRTNMIQGVVHLMLLFTYLILIFE